MDSLETLYHRAINLLSYREHSGYELQTKLQQKGYDNSEIQTILSRLIAKNYLNDARFAELYCQYRTEKGYGAVKIRYELQQKGVDSALIHAALAVYAPQWNTLVESVRNKRFGNAQPQTLQQRKQQINFLKNRGFDWAQIQSCFKQEA